MFDSIQDNTAYAHLVPELDATITVRYRRQGHRIASSVAHAGVKLYIGHEMDQQKSHQMDLGQQELH